METLKFYGLRNDTLVTVQITTHTIPVMGCLILLQLCIITKLVPESAFPTPPCCWQLLCSTIPFIICNKRKILMRLDSEQNHHIMYEPCLRL